MSPEESREIKGRALLEYEEAKADLALLRAKADAWLRLFEQAVSFLTCAKRDSAATEEQAKKAMGEVIKEMPSLEAVVSIRAVLQLDGELAAAVARMRKAEAAKKDLGFNGL